MVSIMKIPHDFKIRKKSDAEIFIKDCMTNGSSYYLKINKEKAVILEKDSKGNVSVCIKTGDLNDIFNPLLEVARTNNNCYKKTVEDYIWIYRKYINAQWFNER